jgi:argininosuccinate lyase
MVLRFLAVMTIYGVTLCHIATDLLQWLTGEFDFLSLPRRVGGIQFRHTTKENPFLLADEARRSNCPWSDGLLAQT